MMMLMSTMVIHSDVGIAGARLLMKMKNDDGDDDKDKEE